jgi:hypothetical protein
MSEADAPIRSSYARMAFAVQEASSRMQIFAISAGSFPGCGREP